MSASYSVVPQGKGLAINQRLGRLLTDGGYSILSLDNERLRGFLQAIVVCGEVEKSAVEDLLDYINSKGPCDIRAEY